MGVVVLMGGERVIGRTENLKSVDIEIGVCKADVV